MSTYVVVSIRGEDRLRIFYMDATSGRLQAVDTVAVAGGPGPLATDPAQRYLYVGLRTANEIATLRIDSSGKLSNIGKRSLDSDPCYMATDRSGRYLLSAYYRAGKVTVHTIGEDGAVGEQVAEVITDTHAHCIQTDPANRFAFVPHTEPANRIVQFAFDAQTGALTPNPVASQVLPEAGMGPRHFVLHPDQPIVYVSNEQGSSVTVYHADWSTGTLSAFQTLSTLPAGYEGDNSCAQIHIHPSGRFLYVSNRGHDSIACFAIDRSGRLSLRGQQATEPVPRAFNLDPSGNFLYAAGQTSGRLAAYRIHPQEGTLQALEVYDIGKEPLCVMLLDL